MQKTHNTKQSEIERQWWLIDADDVILGRLAAQAAHILRGKHKPTFSLHLDTGDHVVIINAAKIRLSGKKLEDKIWYRHSGYPGGLRAIGYGDLMSRRPELAVHKAVKGMLPHNRLGRSMLTKLKVYSGSEHPHAAQQPRPYDLRPAAPAGGGVSK
jgi:large subunit ribosomal protein L13